MFPLTARRLACLFDIGNDDFYFLIEEGLIVAPNGFSGLDTRVETPDLTDFKLIKRVLQLRDQGRLKKLLKAFDFVPGGDVQAEPPWMEFTKSE